MRRIQRGRPISIAGSWHHHRHGGSWAAPRRTGHGSNGSFWPSRLFLTAAVSGAVLIIAFWAAFWAPWLRVTDVRVEGASPATAAAVKDLIYEQFDKISFLVFPQENILVFDVDLALRTVKANFIFDDLKIEKKLPNQLIVSVKEKTVRAVFWDGNRFWALDGTGFAVREVNEHEIKALAYLPPEISAVETAADPTEAAEGAQPAEPAPAKKTAPAPQPTADRLDNGYPLIMPAPTPDRKGVVPGNVVLPPALMSLILQAYARLPDIAEQPAWFNLMNSQDSIEVVMESGWRAFLTSNTPFDIQASRLALILRDKIGDRRSALDYADLRYDERVFLRFKDGTTK